MNTFAQSIKHLTILLVVFALITGCTPKTAVAPAEATSAPVTVASTATPVPPTAVPPTATTAAKAAPVAAPQLELINAKLSLDPALTQDADSLKISQYLYEGLVQLDASGKPAAGLAGSWVISDDQLDYIFTIRSGMSFSDGSPITPDVIVANFNRWFDSQNALHGQGDFATWKKVFLGFHGEKDSKNEPISPVDGIQKVDQKTVLVHLNRAVPDLLTDLANPAFAILSPDALSKGAYGGRDSAIVSSGPYMVKAWTDEGLQLTSNPKYWGKAAQDDLQFGWKK